jgi:hypothetical protein
MLPSGNPAFSRSRESLYFVLILTAIAVTPAAAQVAPVSVDSAVSINRFAGQHAADEPDIVVDVTATVRLGKGWVAYARPWFRRASTDPYAVAKEIYQAALQYQRSGPVSTRVDVGYILSPIGLGMLDMRPDTNPAIMTHLSYVVPMPSFDAGVPSALPIASSYPLGGQFTASTTKWDARAAVLTAPPNRMFVLNAATANPRSRPTVVVGGGVTPRTGLRVGLAYASGEYATASELTQPSSNGRHLDMVSLEGEFAFGYTRLSGEFTHDALETAAGQAVATEWFLQGVQSLTPRWFVAGRYEGANAPPRSAGKAAPTLGVSEITAGFRLSRDFTLRSAIVRKKTYFSPASDLQVGASLVWARRWL